MTKTRLVLALMVVAYGCTSVVAQKSPANDSATTPSEKKSPTDNSSRKTEDDTRPKTESKSVEKKGRKSPGESGSKKQYKVRLKLLTGEQQQSLLSERIKGEMGLTFGRFAKPFFISSKLQLSTGIQLMTRSRNIALTQIQSPFPKSYNPTLREFFNSLALQTFSEWSYDPEVQFGTLTGKKAGPDSAPLEGFAVFEFKPTKREKPWKIDLAKGWTAQDMGTWVMHRPLKFPVGMDIYEAGTYSTKKTADPKSKEEFFNSIRTDVSMLWANLVNKNAQNSDLEAEKVGDFDALYYESLIPSRLGKEIKWRQWVFMDGNKCYFIVSTILPELEEAILPDVEKMLSTFKTKKEDVKTKTTQ